MNDEDLKDLQKLFRDHEVNTAVRDALFTYVSKLHDNMYFDGKEQHLVVPLEIIKTELELALERLKI